MVDSSSDAQEQLFDHLIAEFGDTGRHAVAFLQTAQGLVEGDVHVLPRNAAAASYCLREALKRLLPPEPDVWPGLTDDVLNATTRFEAVRNLPGADQAGALDDLLQAIARLSVFRKSNEGKNVRRLARLIESRTGTFLFPSALQQYQRVLRDLDSGGVHGSSISLEEARELAGRSVAVLTLVFGPFQMRRPELDLLAAVSNPDNADVDRLLSVCSGPNHLTYFMQRAISPDWLPLLSPTGMLNPPQQGGSWPTVILVERLGSEHGPMLANWLESMYKSWSGSEGGASYVALAARMLLPHASTTLLRALQDFPNSQWIRAQTIVGLEAVDPSTTFVDKVAGVMLQSAPADAAGRYAEAAADALLAGLDAVNASSRLHLLSSGLATSTEGRLLLSTLSDAGSVEQIADAEIHEAGHLLRALLTAISRSREFGTDTGEVLESLEHLPAGLRDRMRAWTLRQAPDISTEQRASEISRAIRSRSPNTEDVLLIDKITSDATGLASAKSWRDALGVPPAPEEVAKALNIGQLPASWRRARFWHPVLPLEARAEWDVAVALMAPALSARGRADYFESAVGLQLESARSPFTKSELLELDVNDAARKISAWRPTGDHLTIARELGRTLEELVAEAPEKWADHPLETLALLRHPTYINHFFAGLSKSSASFERLGPRIVEAITVAALHPWSVVTLGADDFDYDPSWTPVDEACIDLIGRLAERDIDLGSRYDEAWALVIRAVGDRSASSRISRRDDPLETAINRPCTRALQAMFQLMGTEFRRTGRVRADAFRALDEALSLNGWDGAEHRAIIAPRLAFLLHVAPGWVEQNDAALFGAAAPDELGQPTMNLALKWGRPNRWLLERHHLSLLRAVRTGSERAMDHLMVAMLWDLPGCSASEVVAVISQLAADQMSNAGESVARLLRPDEDANHLEAGIRFWRQCLAEAKTPNVALHGFGWWAEVEIIDKALWEELTLATCDRANGNLALSHRVAERAALSPVTSAGILILATLLRGSHEPWDRSHIAQIALLALAATSQDQGLNPARTKLRSALNDYGFFES